VVTVFKVPQGYLDLGRQRWMEWCSTVARCAAEDVWPEYAQAPVELEPPDWVLRQLEREAA
jgi:hypothetical protein